VSFFEQAAQLEPNSHLPFFMLGNAANEMWDLDRAVVHYARARDLAPNDHVIRYNLGLSLFQRGCVESALQELEISRRISPSYAPAQTTYILALHNSDQVSPDQAADAIRAWGARLAAANPAVPRPANAAAGVERRYRVGFVSGDFRIHSVAHFFQPILEARDRDAFEYFLYGNSAYRDSVTEQFRASSDQWRDVAGMDDNALLALILSDRIDILVDLSGHTDCNRLAVFARRAAPVQITYLGFPNSTGLPTMDFRITDASTDPERHSERWHSETLLRMPDTQWCFRPFNAPTPAEALPAHQAGHVTFGSFNSLTKASQTLLDCWIQILTRAPSSRLKLTRIRSPQRAAEIISMFERAGIASERISWTPYRDNAPHGAQFAGVDLALDHFPYNGVTTTCESLYVGVPVITLQGRHCVSRSGLSILQALSLDELIAHTAEQYVEIALRLASDLDRLDEIRRNLRTRFERSPLRDEKGFARAFEELLRAAWRLRLARP
jgi:protein O-GlcNAc transferase